MSKLKTLTSVALIGATALSFSVPAISAPIMVQPRLIQSSASLPTENVQYYRGYGYGGGYRGRGYGYGHRGGGNGALIGGLAAGAIIGGAIAAGAAQQNAQSQQNANYCAQRYRSYDPQSGTYLNNDGNRYPCP
ncbi:BA14K family protein [Tardiphaga sp. vice352]|uniref:BA14K family protein n=2 Tax=Tardiphaga TaxID=1395974 RepID=UPI001164132D|nr:MULTISPECIES: BA14K family protein [unclassified Tardiphaga]QDM19359.1 BA14K family protein [Tardiphaga sp. vice278]QDM31003.1 BA14K family protein [Tardiphaga sp. vice352]